MDADRFRLIESLYHSALRLDGTAREAFLKEACAGDERLRLDLLRLLASAESADSFLEEPVVSLGMAVMNLEHGALVGKTVGRYRLTELLGSGGMGDVYLAHDPRLRRRVALKLLPSDLTGDPSRVRRFEQEARAASAIPHPNVAHIYEIGEAAGRHYIAMEYVPGRTLRRELERGLPGLARALDIAIQVSTTLEAARKAGVIHRDIKPENIMLLEDGYVKVLDFGLAKLTEHKGQGLRDEAPPAPPLSTEPNLLMGTSHYMSPEQVRRSPVDARTDLWSLGVVLYEMLSGRRPFRGGSHAEVLAAILERAPEPLGSIRADLPPRLQEIVTKALSKDPDDRYQTAEDFLKNLREVSRQIETDGPAARTAPDTSPEPTETPSPDSAAQQAAPVTAELERPVSVPMRLSTAGERVVHDALAYRRRMSVWAWVGLLALTLAACAGLYRALSGERRDALFVRDFKPRFERLNLSGDISDIVISPDGKYVASVVVEKGKPTVHITELATASDLRVIPPTGKNYSGLSFSPDGNYVYYLEQQVERGDLHRVSKFGSGQRKILSDINTPVTFSPDGTRIAFVRHNAAEDTPDLTVASADGASEQVLARRTRADANAFLVDMNGAGPAWSPDGKLLACPTLSLSGKQRQVYLEVLDAADGSGRVLDATPWYDISRIAWLADGSGLVVAAKESAEAPWQLALLSYPGGTRRRLTNDPNNFGHVSATSDSDMFLTLSVEESSSIWLVTPEAAHGSASPLQSSLVSQQKGVSEIVSKPGGGLFYVGTDGGGNPHLWTQEADGGPPRQLTFEHKDYRPAVSPDGRYVVFVSARAGMSNIWRMDADGTRPMQLTTGSYEDMPSVTPDGASVIYRTGNALYKVSIGGGRPAKLLDKSALCPTISPDGRLLAYFTDNGPDSRSWNLEVLDLQTLSVVKRLPLPDTANPFNGLRWTADGNGLTYISSDDGAANLWAQPLDGAAAHRLTDFKDAEIRSFAWSGDGRRLICVRRTKTYTPVTIRPF
ncbi:MAG: eukaryotic-like serine/threonine-protein kinase [Acidobacteriota bacterium]|jgi:serine/threonine protein kinase/Tol biopolymer transport system component|nr:eukaryotic-like serine/threonine-protein kinase [Acidobacteriota bacterium]